MPVLSDTVLIDAALPAVSAAVREIGALRRAAAGTGPREAGAREGDTREGGPLDAGQAWLVPGAEVRLGVRLAPGVRLPLRLRVGRVELDRLQSTLVAGPLRRLVHTSVLTGAPTGTSLTESVDWAAPDGVLGRLIDVVLAPRVVRLALRRHLRQVAARAGQLQTASAVVAAAVIDRAGAGRIGNRGNRVLVQQRAYPAAVAGRWELPGGRVEPGESAQEALVRECREELAVRIVPGARLGPDVPLPGGRVLRVYLARLADPAVRPVAVEHTALRWVDSAGLTELDWLDADRAVLPDLELALCAR